MSRLIKKDNECKNKLIKLLASVENDSPFSEFDNDNEDNVINLNLGSCPSLLSKIPFTEKNIKIETKLVIFTVVKPRYGNPFLEFLTHKFPNDILSFPIVYTTNGELDDVGSNFIKKLNMPYSHLGYFVNDTYDILHDHLSCYSVYEVDIDKINSDKLMESSLMFSSLDRIWVTTNEVLNKQVLNMKISETVYDFISNIGEGISRLYKQGEIIPCPRIGYIGGDLDFIDSVIDKLNVSNVKQPNINIGDYNYGIISTFFKLSNKFDLVRSQHTNTQENDVNDPVNDDSNSNYSRIDEYRTNGIILRVAFWDKPVKCIEKICSIENITNENTQTTSRKIQKENIKIYSILKQQCYPLSIHHGRLTCKIENDIVCDSINVINVLKNKMFIFE